LKNEPESRYAGWNSIGTGRRYPYKDDKTEVDEDGLFRKYYSNGQLRYEWYFKLPLDGTRADGISRGWWPNGQLKQIKTWKSGKKVGISTGWHENGQKWYEQTYKDDKKNGLYIEYENGQKLWEGIYKDHELIEKIIIFKPENKDFNYNKYMDLLGGYGGEEMDIFNLENEDNIYKKLKGHIIICRRYGDNVGGFTKDGPIAMEYKFTEEFVIENFNNFKKIVNENMDELIQNLNSRWLQSILECYVDLGTDKEKISALAVLVFLTSDILYTRIAQPSDEAGGNENNCYNLFIRIKRNLTDETSPLIIELVERLFANNNFILNRYNKISKRDVKEQVLGLFGDRRG
jgi:hypothetical protein